MVIQHDTPAPVWGFGAPGTTITVQISGGNSYSNATDASGLWRVTMASHGAGGPHTLIVTSTSGDSATLNDVFFGSVYMCGGQSVRAARRSGSPLLLSSPPNRFACSARRPLPSLAEHAVQPLGGFQRLSRDRRLD